MTNRNAKLPHCRASFAAVLALLAGMTLWPSPGAAQNARFAAALGRLDPQTRLDQVCGLYAVGRIQKDKPEFRPDRARSDVISSPKYTAGLLLAQGGAFRSKGKWYALSFTCKATADNMKVTSFEYKIGSAIPESKWQQYGLWR